MQREELSPNTEVGFGGCALHCDIILLQIRTENGQGQASLVYHEFQAFQQTPWNCA
jgi:hypothetical protein